MTLSSGVNTCESCSRDNDSADAMGIPRLFSMPETLQQGTIQCILDILGKNAQTFYTHIDTHSGQTLKHVHCSSATDAQR